jgi:hypothetical protein
LTHPSHRISSLANVCQTHAARHKSVAFKFLRISNANSGGNCDISEIFVTKMIKENEKCFLFLKKNVYLDFDSGLSARQLVDRKFDPSPKIKINF